MSSLGNIRLSYGKQFNIAIANTYSNIVLAGSNLPANAIIISSNIDESLQDTGSYSIIATDNYGSPVRLTYCIKQGNGLITDDENKDVIILNIDNSTIKNIQGGLHIDLSSINENDIHVNDNKLEVNNDLIDIAATTNRGILAIDGKTIMVDDTLFINTDNLKYSNNETLSYGIISSSDNIMKIDNGIISVEESNIPHAGEDSIGIATADDRTLTLSENMFNVNTDLLDKAKDDEFGIISVDDNKIKSDKGILYVNTDNLKKATVSEKGIVSVDGHSIKSDGESKISVINYDEMLNSLEKLINNINDEYKSLDDIKNHILSQIK